MGYTEMKNNVSMDLLAKDSISSLELCEQINIFRQQEGRSRLTHGDLLKVIRDEFEEEIGQGKISLSEYLNSQSKKQPMYILTLSQAKQVLVREHKTVRKAVIKYIEVLEEKLKKQSELTPLQQQAIIILDDRATNVARIGAIKEIERLGRGTVCDEKVINFTKIEDMIINRYIDEECMQYMTRLHIRETFKEVLVYLDLVYFKKFEVRGSKPGRIAFEGTTTMMPHDKFYEKFVQYGLALIRPIPDGRGKVEIKFTEFIKEWIESEEFGSVYTSIASKFIPQDEDETEE